MAILTQGDFDDPEDRATGLTRAAAGGPLRLRTLVVLRWLAVVGQTGALIVVAAMLDFPLPTLAVSIAILASALMNLALHLVYPASKRLSDKEASLYLAYDVLQLAALLYLTGGLQNPFSFLILVPVTISATILELGLTIGLGALALACITTLSVFHLPLPWRGVPFNLDPIYMVGIWTSLVLGMVFIVTYAWRVAAEARRLSMAVAATKDALAKEQRLSALGALAAAAAHELGTPLATIAIVVRELADDLGQSPHADDLTILQTQTKRCRDILSQLSRRPEDMRDTTFSVLPLTALMEAAASPHLRREIEFQLVADGDGPEPQLYRSPEIVHGLGNLVENAMRYAVDRVVMMVDWDAKEVTVAISDDGPGFPAEVLESLGEPYVTTRRGEGLGLGVFIAKTLIEHSGGNISFFNRVGRGAEVAIRWPRGILDIGDDRDPEQTTAPAEGRETR
ncbi:sensor histidine kinase [Oleomonas cavernae]|uniref:histidine kinase n=1 Tax=Oleomonas cavernae TaxID=2320859 RepID=A0A418WGD6_9PROT|nr:ActS/PrrB/RegB family redox-sensitive histidine kinase [Oleomonas cavernae]RJF89094.1 sensor histidine kinase [Oleomonas cavernae]